MIEMGSFLETVTSIVIAIMAALILRAFIVIAKRPDGTAVWHLAASFVIMSAGIGGRLFYWSALPLEWRQYIGFEKGIVNTLFNLIIMMGLYLVLKFIWLIIPEIDRIKYNIVTAPWYPDSKSWRLDIILNILKRTKSK